MDYRKAQQILKSGDRNAIRTMRIEVFKETVTSVKNGGYEVGGQKVSFSKEDERQMIDNTAFYEKPLDVKDIPVLQDPTKINVVNADSLIVAKYLQDKGYDVAVLNMASRRNPGGGVIGGSGAQEESLFRRTNLFESMYQFVPYASEYGVRKSVHQYPLDRNWGGIYTPNAIVFRSTEGKGYPFLAQPYKMSFIAVAAMNRPELDADSMIIRPLIEPFKNKIRTLFRIGLKHGHDALVLGAWGCGAFRCPPKHVARLFHEVLEEKEFKDKYRQITFAIIEDHNSRFSHNKEGNLKPFQEEFSRIRISKQ